MSIMKKTSSCVMIVVVALIFSSCQTAYYGAMEKIGIHKRDILVDRVKGARDSQDDAKEQFKTALEQFSEVIDFDGGDLEKKYNKLNRSYEKSETAAAEVHERIDKIDSVAKTLFKEWTGELRQYTSPQLRKESQRQLNETKRKYEELMITMQAAAEKMDPVLAVFRDQVLFLKHNLNSRAIASIQTEARDVEKQIAILIRDMEASIAEADAFIRELAVER